MQVSLLGTRGWMPGDRRETTCLAVRSGTSLLIFDAGTGLRRLREPGQAALLDGLAEVHLFLTHYHLDHTCGLAYLPGVLPGRAVTLHAPAAELTGVDPAAAVAGLLRRPYNPRDFADIPGLRLEPVPPEGVGVAGHTVRTRPQQHSDTSVAYRLDDAFVLATDTAPDPGTAEFASGAGVLFHEAWYNEADPRTSAAPKELLPGYAAHSDSTAAARLAADADVGRLVLIHLNPLHDESYYAAMAQAARDVFPHTDVCDDGTVVDAGDAV